MVALRESLILRPRNNTVYSSWRGEYTLQQWMANRPSSTKTAAQMAEWLRRHFLRERSGQNADHAPHWAGRWHVRLRK